MQVTCANGPPSPHTNAMVVTAAQIVPVREHHSDSPERAPLPTGAPVSSSPLPLDRYEDILPSRSVLSQLQRPTLWWESASTVAVLVWDSALGGAVGWLVNYIFSFGNFVSGQSVERQSYETFCAGVMGFATFMVAGANIATGAAAMAKLHFVDSPDRTPTFARCLFRLIRGTFASYVVCLALSVSAAYGLASLPATTHPYKLHFYVSGLFVYVFVVNLNLVHRRIFQLETIEGQQRRTASSSRGSSYIKRLLRLLVKDLLIFYTLYSAAIYIHVSSMVRLDTAAAVFNFSVASYAIKLLTQELTKAVMMYQKKTNVKTIYVAVTVPTVLIDTQIRAMILRQSTLSQSMAGSVTLAVAEISMRFAKVWLIRLEIWVHEKRVVRRITQGPRTVPMKLSPGGKQSSCSAVNVVATTQITVQEDPRYLAFLQWRQRLLRFHAAEIHADMVAEYLAIVCSMSIYYFYHAHPKYAWTNSEDGTSGLFGLKEQAAYLGIQITMEMVVDFLSCLWELVNGVPMQNAKKMRGFISVLFVSSSLTNMVLSAAISINSASSS